jgi:ribosome biogenesis GTPase A
MSLTTTNNNIEERLNNIQASINPVSEIARSVSSFFKWLTHWDKSRARRLDKKSIYIAKKLAFKVKDIESMNEIMFRAKFDEAYKDIEKAKDLANKFLRSLD